MIRSPGAFYYNAMMPHYALAYPPVYKAAKKRKKKPQYLHSVYPYKTKRFSLSYYLKYVLWKKIRRYWKKRQKNKGKAKKVARAPSASVLGNNRGSDEKIGDRDFWGSKYGSQWLFAKQKLQRQQQLQKASHNRLIEIVDAFKTVDLKYANRHLPSGARSQRSRRSLACPDDHCALTPRRCRQSLVSNGIIDQCNRRCRQSIASNGVIDQCNRRCRQSIASNLIIDQCNHRCRQSIASNLLTDQYGLATNSRCRQSLASNAPSLVDQPSRSRRGLSGNENLFISSNHQVDPRCPCVRRQRPRRTRDGFETDTSEWSLSTQRVQRRPYSKWPPHPPPGAKHCCGKEEQLATILSRQHAYVYNWLYVDQLQNKSKLTVDQLQSRCRMSREFLDQVRSRVDNSSRRNSRALSSRCSSAASWSSTLSRREKAKILKKQTRVSSNFSKYI